MAQTVRLRIYDSRIQSLFTPGGDVWQFGRRVGRETIATARAIGPRRSGEMLDLLDSSVTPVPMGCITTVRSTARHSMWVIGGTPPIIRSPDGNRLRLSPGGGYPALIRRQVRGQTGNNFLDRAKKITLAREGVI